MNYYICSEAHVHTIYSYSNRLAWSVAIAHIGLHMYMFKYSTLVYTQIQTIGTHQCIMCIIFTSLQPPVYLLPTTNVCFESTHITELSCSCPYHDCLAWKLASIIYHQY